LSGGKVRFELRGDKPLETSGTFNDTAWHHVVTTVGPGGQQLHVDGKLIATGSLAKRTKVTNRLGLDLGPGNGRGTVAIDEAKVFRRAFTVTELEASER
jgi:hypothetical protein